MQMNTKKQYESESYNEGQSHKGKEEKQRRDGINVTYGRKEPLQQKYG